MRRVKAAGTRKAAALGLLAFSMLIVSLDQYIVVVALPKIGDDLGFSEQTLQAVISCYAVASAGFLLLGGRATDLLGRRRVLVAGLGLYASASFVGGLAGEPAVLLIARAVQGLGGALVFPATLSLVNTTFAEGRERNRAVAIWGAAGAAGLVVGVLLGGVLTSTLGWEAVFWVNVPLAGAAILLAFPLLPRDEPRVERRSLDLPGAFGATLGVTLLVFTLVEGPQRGWGSPAIVSSAVASVFVLTALVVVERRSRDPLVPARVLRNRNLTAAMAMAFMFWATFGSVLYFLSIYLQNVLGYDALETGFAFLLPTGIVVAGSAVAGPLVTRFGLRPVLVVALSIGTLGAIALGVAAAPDRSYAALIPGLVAISIGDGIVFTAIFIAAGIGVSEHEQGVASGLASMSTSIGAAVGLALLVGVAVDDTDGLAGNELHDVAADGTRTALFVIAVGIALTALIATRLRPDPATSPRSNDSELVPVRRC